MLLTATNPSTCIPTVDKSLTDSEKNSITNRSFEFIPATCSLSCGAITRVTTPRVINADNGEQIGIECLPGILCELPVEHRSVLCLNGGLRKLTEWATPSGFRQWSHTEETCQKRIAFLCWPSSCLTNCQKRWGFYC